MRIESKKAYDPAGRDIKSFLANQALTLWFPLSLLLAVLLLALESYYRTRLSDVGTIYIAGPVTFVAMGMIAFLIAFHYNSWNRSRRRSGQSYVYGVRINDEYVEHGIESVWVLRCYWPALVEYSESGAAFDLQFRSSGNVLVRKEMLKPEEIGELRDFLRAKHTQLCRYEG
jgi:hypothetical protein